MPTVSRNLSQRAFRLVAIHLGAYDRDAYAGDEPVWTRAGSHPCNSSYAIAGRVGEVGLFWDHDAARVTAPFEHPIWGVVDQAQRQVADTVIPWSAEIRRSWVEWLLRNVDESGHEDHFTFGLYEELWQFLENRITEDAAAGLPLRKAFAEVTAEAEAILDNRNRIARRRRHYAELERRARNLGIGSYWDRQPRCGIRRGRH